MPTKAPRSATVGFGSDPARVTDDGAQIINHERRVSHHARICCPAACVVQLQPWM